MSNLARWNGTAWASLGLGVVLAPGIAATQLALSYNPALIGAQFHQQTVPLEFDGVGALTAVRGSNALTATVGTF